MRPRINPHGLSSANTRTNRDRTSTGTAGRRWLGNAAPIIGGPGRSTSGPSGQGGTLSTVTNLRSASQIVQALLASLGPAGKEARVAALRKHGSYRFSFLAPSAGTLSIGWYEVPKGAHLSKAKRVLLATGTATATKAGKLIIIVKLNPKGRALLKHGGKVKLTARAPYCSGR